MCALSSHAIPRPRSSTFNFPRIWYSSLMEVISFSPLSDGFTFLAISMTSLSQKYNPGTIYFDFGFSGFSSIESTFLSLSNSATPKALGLLVQWPKMIAPSFRVVALSRISVNLCPWNMVFED